MINWVRFAEVGLVKLLRLLLPTFRIIKFGADKDEKLVRLLFSVLADEYRG
jgi:hypothetical protein